MYWAAFFAAFSLVSASSASEQTEQAISCNSQENVNDVLGVPDIDDYTSVLQVSLSVDKTRGSKAPTPNDGDEAVSAAGVDSITPNPEAQVEQATLDETMVVLGKAGDASFHRLQTSLHTGMTGLWKRLQKEPPYSNAFDFAIGLFVLCSVTTSFVACTLLAIRGQPVHGRRPRRCSAWRALFKVKPEEVKRIAQPLPEFHPAKQHSLQSSGLPRLQYKDLPLSEAGKQQQQRTLCAHYVPQSAEQILQEAERQAAQAAAACEAEGTVPLTEYRKMNHKEPVYELKSLVELEVG
jgi:hypothetical protein